jgi:hypothetical protein
MIPDIVRILLDLDALLKEDFFWNARSIQAS